MKRQLVLAITLSLGVFSPGFGADCDPPDETPVTGCLLELGDLPGNELIPGLPGLSRGRIEDADELSKAAGTGVKTRTWSEPDRREPGEINHKIAINGSLIDALGVHGGKPPYGVEELSLRDPKIDLPCGLRIGQPLKAFVKALSIADVDPERWDPRKDIRLDWAKFWSSDRGICNAAHANIYLRLTPKREVREVRWEYFAD